MLKTYNAASRLMARGEQREFVSRRRCIVMSITAARWQKRLLTKGSGLGGDRSFYATNATLLRVLVYRAVKAHEPRTLRLPLSSSCTLFMTSHLKVPAPCSVLGRPILYYNLRRFICGHSPPLV